MNKKNKIVDIIVLIVIILIVVLIITTINKNKKESKTNESSNNNSVQTENTVDEKYVKMLDNGVKLNDSTQLNGNKKVDDWEISNVQLVYKDGITNLLCDVKNTSSSVSKMQIVKVILRDESGNEVYSFNGVMGEIQPGETKQFNTSVIADFANVYDFTIEKKQ